MVEIVFDDGGTLLPVVVDAATDEIHRFAAIATEQEVERGVAVTDHVRAEARPLQLTVVITDTPFAANAAVSGSTQQVELVMPPRRRQGFQGPASETAAPPIRAQVFVPDSAPDRVRSVWATLVDASERALLATITTDLEQYEDMVLLGGDVTRTVKDGSAITVMLQWRRLRLVETEIVDAPEPVRPRDRRRVNRGQRATTPTTGPQRSLLQRAFGREGLDILGN